jgi:hypothetical protein
MGLAGLWDNHSEACKLSLESEVLICLISLTKFISFYTAHKEVNSLKVNTYLSLLTSPISTNEEDMRRKKPHHLYLLNEWKVNIQNTEMTSWLSWLLSVLLTPRTQAWEHGARQGQQLKKAPLVPHRGPALRWTQHLLTRTSSSSIPSTPYLWIQTTLFHMYKNTSLWRAEKV